MTDKFQPRASTGVFLGYSMMQKGYKYLNLHSGKIRVSQDIKFQENVFPFATQSLRSAEIDFDLMPINSSDTAVDDTPLAVYDAIPDTAPSPDTTIGSSVS